MTRCFPAIAFMILPLASAGITCAILFMSYLPDPNNHLHPLMGS